MRDIFTFQENSYYDLTLIRLRFLRVVFFWGGVILTTHSYSKKN